LESIKEEGDMQDTLAFSHALLDPHVYIGADNNIRLTVAPFLVQDGVHQGVIGESSWFFSFGCKKVFHNANKLWKENMAGSW